MAIPFEKCTAILEQFRRDHKVFLMRSEVHGVQVVESDGQPVIEVLIDKAINDADLKDDEKLPLHFEYAFEAHRGVATIKIRISPIAAAHLGVSCQPGDPATGDPSYYGTLGWNLYLNNVLVGLSNWHVFCSVGNHTQVGASITINESAEASVYVFQPLYPTGNYWDFALAQWPTLIMAQLTDNARPGASPARCGA